MVNILLGCEESQAVCIEFRSKGFNAFSCDTQKCSGGHPEWHIVADLLDVIKGGWFVTQSGVKVFIEKWSALIAFPPCTFITKAGARWMYPTAGNICQIRYKKAMEGKNFFMKLLNSGIDFIALENPMPLKVVELPKYSQILQPFEFGHPYSKKTYLWLKNLPCLMPTYFVNNYKPYIPSNTGGKKRGHKATIFHISQKDRSKTFQGIAKAMSEQWGDIINKGIQTKNLKTTDI